MAGLYVNTNVPSLSAQYSLQNNMDGLSTTLERLSTGLRINSAKDDPAGLIASEILRSDMTAMTKAISNTERANQMVSTADSALGQVSSLLNDIRGLVNEAANTGAMSAEQISANQLQVDASLEAIDRISQTTTFQGTALLDGSLDFVTEGVNPNQVADFRIDQANFGTYDEIGVNIEVTQAAEKARVNFNQEAVSEETVIEVGGNQGFEVFKFENGATVDEMAQAINLVSDATGVEAKVGQDALKGQLMATSAGKDNDVLITAAEAGKAAGNYFVKYSAGESSGTSYEITDPVGDNAGVIDIKLQTSERASAVAEKVDESGQGVERMVVGASVGDVTSGSGAITAGGSTAQLHLSSTTGVKVREVKWVEDASGGAADTAEAQFDKDSGTLTLTVGDMSGVALQTDTVIDAVNEIDGLTATVLDVSGGTTSVTAVTAGAFTVTPSTATLLQSATIAQDFFGDNALDFQANIKGTEYNDTDIVYIAQEVDHTGTAQDLTIDVNGNTTAQVAAGEVGFSYQEMPQRAAVHFQTAQDGPGGLATGDFKLTFTANDKGTKYNDVTFRFVEDTSMTTAVASYNEEKKEVVITSHFGAGSSVTLRDLKDAVEADTDFTMKAERFNASSEWEDAELSRSVDATQNGAVGTATAWATGGNLASKKTGQLYGEVGTDHNALFVVMNTDDQYDFDETITAEDVVNTLNTDSTYESIRNLFTGAFSVDNDGSGTLTRGNINGGGASGDAQTFSRVYSAAMQDGKDGDEIEVTAKDLVEYINNDATLSGLITAQTDPLGGDGEGKLTVFDEAAYYGDPLDNNGIQFLGQDGEANIEFKVDGANTDLGVEYKPDVEGTATAALSATNADAAFTLTAKQTGASMDDVVVRFKRGVNSDYVGTGGSPTTTITGVGDQQGSVQYIEGPSNAFAYASSGDTNEKGNMIISANYRGDEYNNVDIKIKLDTDQSEKAVATYDKESKNLIVTVNADNVTTSEAINAINNMEGGYFSAELDHTNDDIAYTTGGAITVNDFNDGSGDFSALSLSNGIATTIGNTGTTGGHEGGVLEVTLYEHYVSDVAVGTGTSGGATGLFAQNAVDIINNDEVVGSLFSAAAYGSSTLEGEIAAQTDTLTTIKDPDTGEDVNTSRMVTSGGLKEEGHYVVSLATDENGFATTTAKDLVDHWNTLSAEDTGNISASLWLPPGQTISPTDTTAGTGKLAAGTISFAKDGTDMQPSQAVGEIVAVNGEDAGFTIYSKLKGSQYDDITFKYVADPTVTVGSERAEYNEETKELSVFISEGATTALHVQAAFERDLADSFILEQRGDGSGVVTTDDDKVSTYRGTYEASTNLGGVALVGNQDADAYKLSIESVNYGDDQFVSVRNIVGGMQVKDDAGKVVERDYGQDIAGRLNGVTLVGDGLEVSMNTSTLDLSVSMTEDVKAGDEVDFTIKGGGASFQLGPDVVTNQQVRLGIQSVNTARLGGPSGRMYELRSGSRADLLTNTKLADKIVQESIMNISTSRGLLGSLQRSTFDVNISALQNTLEALTSAESSISNADFAQESSNLSRSQILVQSGAKVLGIANQYPQYAAMLVG